MTEQLYNTAILRLASAIPHEGRLPAPAASALKVSPICGSRVTAFVELGEDGRVARFAQEVRACALGQASAAIVGAGVVGRTPGELADARDALAAYLRGEGAPSPDFPDTTLFGPARPYKARHASIRLAFEAAAEAAAQAHAAAQLQAA
jgi:NifU-like protein involved in Fe-S cluster formation